MSKFLRRISLSKTTLCLQIEDFQVFAPGSRDTYDSVQLQITRGKATKTLNAIEVPNSNSTPDTAQKNPIMRRQSTISDSNNRIYFKDMFLLNSQFYMNKQAKGQEKTLIIKLTA